MPESLLEIINKLGLWGTIAWLTIAYAALHALIHGRWPISGASVLRLFGRRHSDNSHYLVADQNWSNYSDDEAYSELPQTRDRPVNNDFAVPSEPTLPVPQSIRYLSQLATRLEQLLHSFGIAAIVKNVEPGPVVTLFEIELSLGVSGKELCARSNDIARVLQVDQVRVLESLPGRMTAGIEVPNRERQSVYLKQLTQALENTDPLTVVLGVDTVGKPMLSDLAAMPHLLVAGTTGSGKSVTVNALLSCLLERNDPRQLRLILIDPKALEFSLYEGIPHLLCPVVTDMRQASRTLAWCVDEMERRYQVMAISRARNIYSYNHKMQETQRSDEQLPYIVVVVDELADLMLTHNKAVEPLIQRLSQKARAAGIHLILATQRPTTNVVSGTIKSNIRTRLSLALPTQTDSRTVLDQVGAEKLLDKGDALLMNHQGLQRIHCPFISDDETATLTERLRAEANHEVDYVDILVNDEKTTVIELMPDMHIQSDDAGNLLNKDENAEVIAISQDQTTTLYIDAVHLVIAEQKATKILLKKELGIGDKKAEELLSKMEQEEIVSAAKGRSRRKVLLDDVPLNLLPAESVANA